MFETGECAVSSDFKRIWIDINQAAMQFITVKLADPVSYTHVKILLIDRFYSHVFEIFVCESNNRLTRHSRCGKHGRFGHVIEQEKCHAVAC